jgi:hypothetical protein
MVKRQFVELVTDETVEFAPEKAMQRSACETAVISPGVIGGACILLVLRQTGTRQYLLGSQRLQPIVVRIAHIHRQAQDA